METTNNTNSKLSAIDKALAAAKARKAMRDAVEGNAPAAPAQTKVAAVKSADDNGAAKIAKTAAREARKAELEKQREERKAARAVATKDKVVTGDRKPAHMKKIEKAAAALPALRPTVCALYEEITANHSADQIAALALHLQHFNRFTATTRALSQKLEVGTQVRIVGGDPKFLGMTGTVERAQRIRCYVAVPGVKKPVYLFTSDVEPLAAAAE